MKEIFDALGNVPVGVCPTCNIIFLKDGGSDHVRCEFCKRDFCFTCHADKIPIDSHGINFN